MKAQVNDIYRIVEDSLSVDDLDRLINELQDLLDNKRKQEANYDTFGF